MASYETEHARDDAPREDQSRRPDMSSIYNLISEMQPSQTRTRQHAVPVPGDISAAHRHLAEAFQTMQQDNDNDDSYDLRQSMNSLLLAAAERPPAEVKGVDEEYIAQLERVPIKKVKEDAECPICGNEFRDDAYPLLVRLPCHDSHIFDLECIRPWLLLNGTCPLDRVDFAQKERDRKQKRLDDIKKTAQPEDEEEEWDGLYG